MTPHASLDDELRDLAARYVLGSLGDDEARAFRQHLDVCALCRQESAAVERLSAEMIELAPRVEPPRELWSRVQARVREGSVHATPAPADAAATQIWKRWSHDAGSAPFTYVDDDAQDFQPTSSPGVFARKLFVDAANDRVTMLVRMHANSSYPSHRHAGPEECYVLAGDLDVGERVMHAGDFVRSAPDSVHPRQSTEKGCLLLIVSSLSDEMLG